MAVRLDRPVGTADKVSMKNERPDFGSSSGRASATRSKLHSAFVAEFQRGARPAPVALNVIESFERDLGARLPAAYRRFLHEQGPIGTPTIPSMVKEARKDIVPVWPVSRFLHPSEAITATHNAWQSGLPRHLIVFAEGPEGTLFCFERNQKQSRSPDDSSVWGYDPELAEPVRMTGSFDELLGEYLEAVYWDEEDDKAQTGLDDKRNWYA